MCHPAWDVLSFLPSRKDCGTKEGGRSPLLPTHSLMPPILTKEETPAEQSPEMRRLKPSWLGYPPAFQRTWPALSSLIQISILIVLIFCRGGWCLFLTGGQFIDGHLVGDAYRGSKEADVRLRSSFSRAKMYVKKIRGLRFIYHLPPN